MAPHAKCVKLARELPAAAVDLAKTGHRDTNALVKFLVCEARARKACTAAAAEYRACHSSVMGAGSFQGTHHCEKLLLALKECLEVRRRGN